MKNKSLFSREQDYSLRITAFLASLKIGQIINVNKLSKKLHISKIFAARIIHKLKNENITGSVQGKYGGVYLKANPEEISIWDVLNAVGFNTRLNDCMNDYFTCELMSGCKFHKFFLEQEKILMDKLKSQKISDYVFQQFK
jgi:Rrf2 family nitric oxide-sensitive transcriptional repressor